MTEIQATVAFKSLTAQTSAVLLTQGMEAEPTAVQGVLARVVTVTTERTGLDEEALHLVTPEAVADLIAQAADERLDGAKQVHAVRPVRVDARTVPADLGALGRLVMAAAQAGKYAATNHDGRAAAHDGPGHRTRRRPHPGQRPHGLRRSPGRARAWLAAACRDLDR